MLIDKIKKIEFKNFQASQELKKIHSKQELREINDSIQSFKNNIHQLI